MNRYLTIFIQFGLNSFKPLSEKLWLLTHVAIATYLLTLSISQSSINHFVTHNFNNALGADGLVSTRSLLDEKAKSLLTESNIGFAETADSSVVLTNAGAWLQIRVKAVDNNYPIAGKIIVAEALSGETIEVDSGPKPSEIWLDEGAAAKLNLRVGEQITFGQIKLLFSKVLKQEPDWLLSAASTVPRGMINLKDLAYLNSSDASEHGQETSRNQYSYLLSNSVANETKLNQLLVSNKDVQIQVFSEGKHPFSDLVDRAFKIFSLVTVLLIALAAIALNMSDEESFKATAKTSALLINFGMSKTKVVLGWLVIMTAKLGGILVLATGLAVVISLAIMASVEAMFANLTLQWQLVDLTSSLLIITFLFFTSLLPNFAKLLKAKVKPLLFEHSAIKAPVWIKVASLLLSFCAVIFIYSDNYQLTFVLIGAMLLAYITIGLNVWLLLRLLEKIKFIHFPSVALAVRMLQIRKKIRFPQIISLGMCAFLLSLSTVLSEEFVVAIERYGFSEQGDMLFDKATEKDLKTLNEWLVETDSKLGLHHPYQFAKLTEINHIDINTLTLPPSESKDKISSSIRLSWSNVLPENLQVVNGDWSGNPASKIEQYPGISVEDEVFGELALNIGDVITFGVGDQTQSFTIVASHQRKPGGNLISLWFIRIDTHAITEFEQPTMYLGDVFLSPLGKQKLSEFWRLYPNFQLRSVNHLKETVTDLVNTVSLTIILFIGFLIAVCFLVIWTGINACIEQDKTRNALIMSFGRSKFACIKFSAFEWLLTGAIAFAGAMLAAYGTIHLVYTYHFGSAYLPQYDIYFWVFLEGIVDFTLLALLLSITTFNTSVKSLLTGTKDDNMLKVEDSTIQQFFIWRKFKLWRRFYNLQKHSNNKRI